MREISAFYLRDTKEESGEIKVDFLSVDDEKIFEVRLRRLDNAFKILKSCGDEERSFIPQYILLSIGEA